MTDLISREAVRNELLKISICTDDLYGMGIFEGLDRATRRVNDAPAVDAVAVVRCRDCKHWDVEGLYCHHPAGLSYCGKTGAQKGFCCFGERREENA